MFSWEKFKQYFLGAQAPLGIASISLSVCLSLTDQKVSEKLEPACYLASNELDDL